MDRGDEPRSAAAILQEAQHTYLRLQDVMMRRIDELALGFEAADAEGEDGAARAKRLGEELARLQAALVNVLKYEERVAAEIARCGDRPDGVDLDAARREILGELARLAERG